MSQSGARYRGVSRPFPIRRAIAVGLALLGSQPPFAPAAIASTGGSPPAALHFAFQPQVLNVEYARESLQRSPAPGVIPSGGATGGIYFGVIPRRVRAADGRALESPVPFQVEYTGGLPRVARCDADGDGDLRDDPDLKLWSYPEPEGARSFLVDLAWDAPLGDRVVPIAWKVRIALEPQRSKDATPAYHVQRVQAMAGQVTLDGRSYNAFLFDGSADGLYTRDSMDGVFLDLEGDSQPVIDLFSREFGPFTTPFQVGARMYSAVPIDPQGTAIELLDVGEAEAGDPSAPGRSAPLFSFRDVEGRDVRLVDQRGHHTLLYFWASWCGTSRALAPAMRDLYGRFHPRGLEILGISFDSEVAPMEAFREKGEQIWPTSFSGRGFFEDPVGRLYGVRGVPAFYLIDPLGRMEGTYDDPEVLSARLEVLLRPPDGTAPP